MSAYYNDNDAYCCRVLRKNIAAGHLPPGDVDERDIRDVQPNDLAGYAGIHLFAGIGGLALAGRMAGLDDTLGICTGGFPCQDISLAGPGTGLDGARSGLWHEMARLLGALRPRYVVVENSAALLGRGMGRVLGDLAALGYDAWWDCVTAASVGAPHLRARLFVVAHAPGHGRRARRSGRSAASRARQPQPALSSVADAHGTRLAQRQGVRADTRAQFPATLGGSRLGPEQWAVEPGVGRVADGVPHRVDRLRGLGNAVVPQAAAVALRRIAAYEQESRP